MNSYMVTVEYKVPPRDYQVIETFQIDADDFGDAAQRVRNSLAAYRQVDIKVVRKMEKKVENKNEDIRE